MASLINEAAASSSSSSLPLSSTDHQNHYRHHAFLSFRGDTRFSFTDHLYKALCDRGIETFRDADKLRIGEEIAPALLKAIEESRVSIVVFSQNYASSRWCLDELVKILECSKSKGQEVKPVFYKVDPSHVRHQIGAFGDAFVTLGRRYGDSMDKWKAALNEASHLFGWQLEDREYETDFIERIVRELSVLLNLSCDLHVAEHLIGLESCTQDVIRRLDAEKNNMVGIWGPGGIGKTTTAKNVFNSIRHKFEGSCYLADVRSISTSSPDGLAQLQHKLLSDILRDPEFKVSSVDQGVGFIKERMQSKRVLLILDDVSSYSQLQKLVPSPDCFRPGSRILITTRDKGWLPAGVGVYEVKMLNGDQALKLFSLHAFKSKEPPDDCLELARRVVRYAGGLPLALTVLGSHLSHIKRDRWGATLDSCKGEGPHLEIRNILKVSYDALGEDLKGCFLDIACFFKGKLVDKVRPILEACYNNLECIALLEEKALIRIDGKENWMGVKIWMHDLIEELGKEIARREGEPGRGSRLWNYNDIYDVLTYNEGTEKMKGIQVEQNQQYDEIRLNAKSFSEMKYLRYFSSSSHVKYSGNIDFLPYELRWLNWFGCPIQSFPSNFHSSKLVALRIPYSPCITRLWEGVKSFQFLTSMDLRGCKSLTKLPNFTKIPNLKELNLCSCDSLVEVHQSVGSLDKLVTLNLRGCSNLVRLPTKISLKSLIAMDLSDCHRLEEFPEVIGKMDSLGVLILSFTRVKELHPSIGNLTGLNQLCLVDCKNLITLPCSIYELQNLEILDVRGCSKLVTFPTKASISHGHDSGPLALPKLRVFRINGCNLSTADFIGSLDCLETLTELDLSSNNFVSVPALGKFVNLPRIDLYCCKRLREISELPPNILEVNVRDCESLESFLILPNSLKMLEINLWNCHGFSYNLENNLLSNQKSRFRLVLPGSEVPKWFHCSKEVAANEKGPSSTCAISYEIPSKLNWENIGVAVCSVEETSSFMIDGGADISIDGVLIDQCSGWRHSTPDHMWLTYIPLSDEIKGKLDQKGGLRYQCRVQFYPADQIKSCGVHLVCQPPKKYSYKNVMAADESGMLDCLWLSCANPEQKRPRTEATDDYHHHKSSRSNQ